MNCVNLYVPGIRTFPGDEKNWDSKAVTHTHLKTGGVIVAEKVEYFTTALLRPVGDRNRAVKLSEMLAAYKGWSIRLIGHSNGCDVILDGLAKAGWPRIDEVHLVCGACEASLEKSGLNAAVKAGRIGSIAVYIAEADQALRLAHTLPGKILGYGTLGLHGATDVSPEAEMRLTEIRWPGFGHSDCWAADRFERTMDNFLA